MNIDINQDCVTIYSTVIKKNLYQPINKNKIPYIIEISILYSHTFSKDIYMLSNMWINNVLQKVVDIRYLNAFLKSV